MTASESRGGPGLWTEGRCLLLKWFEIEGNTQHRLAAMTGIGQSSISMWKTGRTRPGPHHRTALEKVLKIPQGAWLTPSEHAQIENAQAAPPLDAA